MKSFIEQKFEKIDSSSFITGEYEGCSFINCNLYEVDFSNSFFIDCTFDSCNLTLANLNHCSFQEVQFIGSKLMGCQFKNCSTFGLSIHFQSCLLNHASFYKLNLKGSLFINSNLSEVDFTACNLKLADFSGSDLNQAVFMQTVLEQADFRTALNFQIDPTVNKLRKALFSLQGLPGLLSAYQLHISE